MKKYQNVLVSRNASTFVENGSYDGSTIDFASKSTRVTRGAMGTDMVSGRVVYQEPVVLKDCNNDCVTVELSGGFTMSFNIQKGDVTALDRMQAEANRIFTLAKTSLVHGLVPSSAETFPVV